MPIHTGTRGVCAVKRLAIILLAIGLIAAACAEGEVGGDDVTTTQAPVSSTTTVADTTTTSDAVASTSTTTSPSTTEDEPTAEFAALVASLEETSRITSARVEGSIAIKGIDPQVGPVDAEITFATAFDAATGDSSFSMDFSSLADAFPADPDDPMAAWAGGLFGELEFRQVGDTGYVKFPLFTEMLGVDTEWVSMPPEQGAEFSSGFESMPSDPHELLDAYDGADATVEDLGVESVNGVDATHYRVSFDASRMVAEMTAEERAEFEASGLFADGVIPLDLWISDDGHLIRLVFSVDGSTITAPEGEGFEEMTIRYDMFDINGNVTIEAPPAGSVTPVEDLGAGGFFFEPEA
jgi:hypothetical protein